MQCAPYMPSIALGSNSLDEKIEADGALPILRCRTVWDHTLDFPSLPFRVALWVFSSNVSSGRERTE
eukprot:m.306046 g.306046  ORF g.306046 m.306046 type:complete len:67 (-) comp27356_c1_seq6:241-441(-)